MPVNAQTLGTLFGAAAGSFIGAPQIGAGIGGSIGGMIDTNKANKDAQKAEDNLSETDNNVTKFLKEIHDRNLSYKTGSGASFYTDEAKEAGASAVAGVIGLSGGNTGAALGAAEGVGKGVSRSVNEILANLEKQNQFGTTLEASLIQGVAQRKLEMNLAKYAQTKADQAQKETDKNNMVTSLVGLTDYDNLATNSEKSDSITKMIEGLFAPEAKTGFREGARKGVRSSAVQSNLKMEDLIPVGSLNDNSTKYFNTQEELDLYMKANPNLIMFDAIK